tara:strand:+ start:8451 stop:9644 length:1194 start_codon:yes stop_codon:yes gene_type:complete
MTVSNQSPRTGPDAGNGSTVTFSYTFLIEAGAELVVVLTDAAGLATVQTLTTHYTVSGVGNPAGGDLTFVTAPATGETVTIIRNIDATQAVDLVNRGKVVPSIIEASLDKLTRMFQNLEERVNRTPQLAVSSIKTNVSLPDLNAGATLVVRADLLGYEEGPLAGDIAAAQSYAEAAAASAVTAGLTLIEFEAIYLGSKTADPTLDNEGSALIDGAMYYDTTVGATKLYDLSTTTWVNQSNYTHPNHSGDVTSVADGPLTITDGAVTLAKMAGGTDGNLISYDAAGAPVAVATGTAGQVLTSAGAGAPPTMADVPSALVSFNAVGSYSMLKRIADTTTTSAGASYAGSLFNFAALYWNNSTSIFRVDGSGTPSGTWRIMGYGVASTNTETVVIALRIA